MATPQEIARQAQRLAQELTTFAEMLGEGRQSVNIGKAIPHAQPVPAQEKPNREIVRPKKSTYNNDPTSPDYDPEPPFRPDPLPPRPKLFKSNQLVIAEDTIIVCEKCKQPAVRANRNIYNTNDKENGLSLDALDILDKRFDWPEQVKCDKKNGITLTCPLCGQLGLPVISRPANPNATNTNKANYSTGSI